MMLNNNPYSEVKGFNYWPSYAMVLNDVMDRLIWKPSKGS